MSNGHDTEDLTPPRVPSGVEPPPKKPSDFFTEKQKALGKTLMLITGIVSALGGTLWGAHIYASDKIERGLATEARSLKNEKRITAVEESSESALKLLCVICYTRDSLNAKICEDVVEECKEVRALLMISHGIGEGD